MVMVRAHHCRSIVQSRRGLSSMIPRGESDRTPYFDLTTLRKKQISKPSRLPPKGRALSDQDIDIIIPLNDLRKLMNSADPCLPFALNATEARGDVESLPCGFIRSGVYGEESVIFFCLSFLLGLHDIRKVK